MSQLPLELRTAQMLKEEGQYREAEQQCRQFLARQPEDAEGLYLLGAVLLDQNQPEEALLSLQQALALAPANGDCWLKITEALLALGQPRQALETIEGIIAKGLDWPAALALREQAKAAAQTAAQPPDPWAVEAPCWTLGMPDGVRVCVPPGVQFMTSYVLLEQEDWFEAELPFLRALIEPGMGVLDIGANHGVYALSLAKRLEGQGRVLACEPASAPAALLERSIIENGLTSLISLMRVALSDHEGEAALGIGPYSELNSLGGNPVGEGATETVRLTTLDALMHAPEWPDGWQVDILKLDAEGEEVRILQGGPRFFAEQDPLVLFELDHGSEPNIALLEAFGALGYGLYRLVPALHVLVPVTAHESLDSKQLNLFACKPGRAARLRAAGRLLTPADSAIDALPLTRHWSLALRDLPFAAALLCAPEQDPGGWLGLAQSQAENAHWNLYEFALNAYLSASDPEQPPAARWAWLCQARRLLEDLAAAGDQHTATRMLQIRLLDACGARAAALECDAALATTFDQGERPRFDRPFLPPLASFDPRPPRQGLGAWLRAAVLEGGELRQSDSSRFHRNARLLQSLAENPNRCLAMDRRLALLSLLAGQPVPAATARAILQANEQADGLNASLWAQLFGSAPAWQLCLGGREPKPGWRILNIAPGPGIDEVADIRDLSHYPEASCSAIYASHVLEHVPVAQLLGTLKGWRRILRDDGRLMISVPDLDLLCARLIDPQVDLDQRFHIMRMLFGGQTDAHDFHYIGLNFEFLANFLIQAGFPRIERVESFGLFADTSDYAPYGQRISLNVAAFPSAAATVELESLPHTKTEVGSPPAQPTAPASVASAPRKPDSEARSPFIDLMAAIEADPIAIVDIGAASEGKHSEPYAPLMRAGCATLLGFEPDPASCEELQRLYGDAPAYRFVPCFVGSGQDATYHQTSWSQTGSLFRPNAPLLERFEQLGEVTALQATHAVKTARLADMPEAADIDMIKIDVQGAELSVFAGAGERLDSVLLIWTEVEFLPLYEEQPLFGDLDSFLRDKGFLLHCFPSIAGRRYKVFADRFSDKLPRRGQMLWADAIYVRDFRRFHDLPTRKLKKLAILLDQVVGAQDLCLEVLMLIDQREKTDLAGCYLNTSRR